MKTILALLILTATVQANAITKIVDGTYDSETGKAHLTLETSEACNNPQFAIIQNGCHRRIDGPCYYQLKITRMNKMACHGKKGIIHRVVDVPGLGKNMTGYLVGDDGSHLTLQVHPMFNDRHGVK